MNTIAKTLTTSAEAGPKGGAGVSTLDLGNSR